MADLFVKLETRIQHKVPDHQSVFMYSQSNTIVTFLNKLIKHF